MSRIGNLITTSAGKSYISTRGLSSVIALILALSYTKVLGIDKRSILAFIMVSALILTIILTSGISLALRNKPRAEIKDEDFIGYLLLIILSSLAVGVINCLLLLLYSSLKADIPLPIFIVCFVYSFLASTNLGFQDALLAIVSIKIATIFDLITVIIQVLSFVFFVQIEQTSLIISVFIAFIFSYALITFATGSIILTNIPIQKSMLLEGMRRILQMSKNHHLYGIANGLADRIDRFLIGLLLPITFLAKYALLSSIISFARFLPDSAVKINLLKHHKGQQAKQISYRGNEIALIFILGLILVGLSQGFVFLVFGREWLLPISVGILFMIQEILRGNYQLKATELLAIGGVSEISKISTLLILLSPSLVALGVYFFGIWAVPAAMVIVYVLLTSLVELAFRKRSHAR